MMGLKWRYTGGACTIFHFLIAEERLFQIYYATKLIPSGYVNDL